MSTPCVPSSAKAQIVSGIDIFTVGKSPFLPTIVTNSQQKPTSADRYERHVGKDISPPTGYYQAMGI